MQAFKACRLDVDHRDVVGLGNETLCDRRADLASTQDHDLHAGPSAKDAILVRFSGERSVAYCATMSGVPI
ncbi:hypothetical protein D3C83_169410 [compost metagenome]